MADYGCWREGEEKRRRDADGVEEGICKRGMEGGRGRAGRTAGNRTSFVKQELRYIAFPFRLLELAASKIAGVPVLAVPYAASCARRMRQGFPGLPFPVCADSDHVLVQVYYIILT